MVPVCTEVISDHIRSHLEITSHERNLALYHATKQSKEENLKCILTAV
ncbi:unnamed protein product [Brassica rapa subsp. trilocularis]